MGVKDKSWVIVMPSLCEINWLEVIGNGWLIALCSIYKLVSKVLEWLKWKEIDTVLLKIKCIAHINAYMGPHTNAAWSLVQTL